MNSSHPGSIRQVAIRRRIAKEKAKLETLCNLLTQGEDGKWRMNGRFASKKLVNENLGAREECEAVISSCNRRLKTFR